MHHIFRLWRYKYHKTFCHCSPWDFIYIANVNICQGVKSAWSLVWGWLHLWRYMGQVKNNKANVLPNGPKIIYLWCISASFFLIRDTVAQLKLHITKFKNVWYHFEGFRTRSSGKMTTNMYGSHTGSLLTQESSLPMILISGLSNHGDDNLSWTVWSIFLPFPL